MSDPRVRLMLAGWRLLEHAALRVRREQAYPLADLVGLMACQASSDSRAAVSENLARVLGRSPTRREVAAVFCHGARNYYDTFAIPTLTRDELLQLVSIPSWEPIERALALGRGAIMVCIHLSSVALAGQVVAARGYRVTAPTERIEPPELNEMFVRARAGGGIRIVSLGPDLMKELLGTLARNEIVGLVMDRDVAGTGIPTRFFGANASIPSGAAVLALRTGAPLIPAVAARTPSGRFAGIIDEPIVVERGPGIRSSVAATTQRIAERLEPYIRAYPEQWTVFQRFWPSDPTRYENPAS